MKRFAALGLAALAFAGSVRPASAEKYRDAARLALVQGHYDVAFDSFSAVAPNSGDAGLVAEYAYAAALQGWTELSLTLLDRAFLLDSNDVEARFVASKVLDALSVEGADELRQPPPAWLGGPGPDPMGLKHERELTTFKEELAAANVLMTQKRYVSAADRFDRVTKKWPDQALGWSGFAIALDNLGAYKGASRCIAKSLELRKKAGEIDVTQQPAMAYQKDLDTRPPWAPPKVQDINHALKGRYLAFLGGNLTHTGSDTLFNLNTRLGKFITNRFDVAGEAGISSGNSDSDFNGVTLGASGRFNEPLPWGFPLNATAAARMGLEPGPGSDFAFVLSPGLSHFTNSGSIDMYIDFNLTGPLKGSQALSVGYTTYFGGGK